MKKYKLLIRDYKLFLLAFLILTLSYSCQKLDKETIDNTDSDGLTSMKDIVVPDGFQWQTSADFNFIISGGALGEVIKITSEDETIVYHKGTYIENNGNYKISLRLPTYLTSMKINSQDVDLIGSSVYYDLSTKSTLANYALLFDGVDDYVDLGDITELNNAASFTLEGWAQQTTNTDYEVLFLKQFDPSNELALYTSGGDLFIALSNGAGTFASWSNYSATILSGTWFHWAVVYDGAGGSDADRLKLYINGNMTPIVLSFTGPIPATTSNSLSGINSYLSVSAGQVFDGKMDEVRIWSTARSAAQINANYNILVNASLPGLVAYYRMNENTATTLGDETSNNYDGTINNGASWVAYVNGFDTDGDGVDDKDDDYWEDPLRAYDNYYPAADTGTIAFEDLWPGTGDYDFNDLLVGYQFKTVTNASNYVTEIYAYLEIRAHGAQLDNGFGFQLPNASPSVLTDVVVTGYNHTTGLITMNANSFESGQTNPVIIAIDKVTNLMDKFENTDFYKPSIPYAPMTIAMTVTNPPVSMLVAGDFDVQNWDPFMYIDQIRGYEVHKIDVAPTDLVNPAYFGTFEDVSVPGSGEYYRSFTGLPWVLEFPTRFDYPYEYANILYTYLHFQEWAESAGTLYADWYSNTAFAYRNTTNIYD